MIRTDSEYHKARQNLEGSRLHLNMQREQLQRLALAPEDVALAMEPALAFHEGLKEDIAHYERLKRGDLGVLHDLRDLGRWLIGIRIAHGLSQKELAGRLGVSEAQVSRDERNEYHGVSPEKAQRILDVFGVKIQLGEEKTETAPMQDAEEKTTAKPEVARSRDFVKCCG